MRGRARTTWTQEGELPADRPLRVTLGEMLDLGSTSAKEDNS
jgi:hypothetical protein